MAGEEDVAAAAEPQQQAGAGEQQPVALPLHALVRALQLQNGLRHGDYQRYRHYTTRRLQRLRKVSRVRACLGEVR